MEAFDFKPIHISEINVGDAVMHNGKFMTVGRNDIKRDDFIGITLFGDNYNSGYRPVMKGYYKGPSKGVSE